MANNQTPIDLLALDYNKPSKEGTIHVKVICLGDSAVGKSKLVERFLINSFHQKESSTYAVTMYRHWMMMKDDSAIVDIWDTAGQEQFSNVHPSYYHQAHACILVFDITRKLTYKNLDKWYQELRSYRPEIPCICAANKIDVDYEMAKRNFQWPKKYGLPFHFVSAADGTNVVRMFTDAVSRAVLYKKNPADFADQVFEELETLKIDDD